MKKSPLFCLLCASLTFVGCGGGSGSENNAPTDNNVIEMPRQAFKVVPAEANTELNFAKELKAADSRINSVVRDEHNSADCPELMHTDAILIGDFSAGSLCRYQVITTQQSDNTRATMQLDVFSSDIEAPILSAISDTSVVGDVEKTYNMREKLGDEWLSGFELDADVTVTGPTDGGAIATVEGDAIVVTPSSKPGVITVVYTLVDSSNVNNVMLGYLYITVSQSAHLAPSITPNVYRHNSVLEIDPNAIKVVSLDLTRLENLTIATEGSWSLDSVRSASLGVWFNSGEPKALKVQLAPSTSIGQHQILYSIKDSYGAYALGQVIVDVVMPERARDWTDVTYRQYGDNIKWLSPNLYSVAAINGAVTPYWDSAKRNTLATYSRKAGVNYCSKYGRLPYDYEFRDKIVKFNNGEAQGDPNKWPKAKYYWATNPSTLETIAVEGSTGNRVTTTDTLLYVACLTYEESLLDTLVDGYSGKQNQKLVRVITSDANGEALFSVISDEFTDQDITFNKEVIDSNSFYVTATANSSAQGKEGIIRVAIDLTNGRGARLVSLPIYTKINAK
ncbi:Hep Hag repeat protein [Vibrio sp. B1FIG11]|uniref:hypothetical protein n=1 Tax=Vibrio TaxID=662 RepID=UPI001AF9FEB3|nr:hypothetical protein [Vibrio sp. B1FIG11]CAD7810207.1 Hep Hag repeat protein [Vibrio sp. B1FIG11]CAE6911423.1 Hep Hag repeat protein [Vibrio sp. B1FIG11]